MPIPFTLVATDQALVEFIDGLKSACIVALDTEFIRVNTFYPKLGLVQVSDGNRVGLLDPLGIANWQPFIELLEDPDIIKVLHACDEDVELFHHALGAQPVRVFDTQIAAALAGFDYSMSYQRLINDLLGIELSKNSSLSDWLKRPLSEEQIGYAIEDVLFLPKVFEQLKETLQQKGLLQAVFDEYQLVERQFQDTLFVNAYQRVSMAWQLKGSELSRLKALASFREQLMRTCDLPRKRIASNDALMYLAKKSELNQYALLDVAGFPAKVNKPFLGEWLAIINQEYEPSVPIKSPQQINKRFKKVKKALSVLAEQHQIAPQLLLRKSEFTTLCEAVEQKDHGFLQAVMPWRQRLYRQVFDLTMSSKPYG